MGILRGSKIVGVRETENFICEELNMRLESHLCSTLGQHILPCPRLYGADPIQNFF